MKTENSLCCNYTHLLCIIMGICIGFIIMLHTFKKEIYPLTHGNRLLKPRYVYFDVINEADTMKYTKSINPDAHYTIYLYRNNSQILDIR